MIATLFFLLHTLIAAPSSSPVPLQEAIDRACEQSALVQQSLQLREEADLGLSLAQKSRLPFLVTAASARYQSERMSMNLPALPGIPSSLPTIEGPNLFFDLSLGLHCPLLSGGRLKGAVTLAQLGRQVSEDQSRLQREQTAWEIKQLYTTDRQLEAQSRALRALQKSLALHTTRIEKGIEVGLSSQADLIQSQEKTTELEITLMEIDRNRLLIADQFLSLCGVALQAVVSDHRETIPTLQESLERLKSHPALDIKRLEADRNRVMEKISIADYHPSMALFAELHGGTPGVNMLSDDWSVYGIVGLTLRMTLFDFNRKKERQAIHQSQRSQIAFELKHQSELLMARIEWLYRQKEALKNEITVQQRLIELSERFLLHQERLWQEGQGTHSDYLSALEHRSQQQSKLDQIEWQIERIKGEINYTLAANKGE